MVQAYSSPVTGVLDLGRYPSGLDDVAKAVAAAFDSSTLASIARPDIMRWKYRKLYDQPRQRDRGHVWPGGAGGELMATVAAEAEAVLDAAGIERASAAEDESARRARSRSAESQGNAATGGSSWQSLQRGVGAIETDYLNGEIVLLGRLHGIPTPANLTLQHLANELAAGRRPPGTYTEAEVLELVASEAIP